MKIVDAELAGVKIIYPNNDFIDYRGIYKEIYNEKLYEGLGVKFVQDDISISKKGTLRGLHGDQGTYKLISCLSGAFELGIINCDKDSKEFGKTEKFYLDGSVTNNIQVLIPPKFANGHLVLEDHTIFHYKQSTYYGDYPQFTVKWDIMSWREQHPILSLRDQIGPFMEIK
ncbi:MAG: dTDP-4-dehydrorhamnose 3,5-epimerase [Novosphingobium sp.]|nr:dTDP-4-dehydrorhamnose 3,5-epimerase [Novosphingobium sp.]